MPSDAASPVLEDVLPDGARVLFCGTAAGTVSARVGAPYAGPGNAFWPTLHAVGLLPGRLAPTAIRRAGEHGVALTDLDKHASGSDAEPSGSDAPAACRAFRSPRGWRGPGRARPCFSSWWRPARCRSGLIS